MKKNSQGGKQRNPEAARVVHRPKNAADWAEPSAVVRDASGVAVDVHEADRGTFHALRHRAIERIAVNVEGQLQTKTKTISTVRQMWIDGEITQEMLDEAEAYRTLFDRAHMDPLRASPMDGMPRSSGSFRQADEAPGVFRARVEFHALQHTVLCGAESPMAQAMWHIVGEGEGFGGRLVPSSMRVTAKANLVCALHALVSAKNGRPKKYT